MNIIVEGIISWIFVIFSFPIFLIHFLILFKCWCVANVLKKLFRKDLLSPVTAYDVSFSIDNFFHKSQKIKVDEMVAKNFIMSKKDLQTKGANSIILLLEGQPDIRALKKSILNLFYSTQDRMSKKKRFDFSKMFSISSPSFWLSFPFWQALQEEFKIEDHIHVKIIYDSSFSLSKSTLMNTILLSTKNYGFPEEIEKQTNRKIDSRDKQETKINNDKNEESIERILNHWLRSPFKQTLWDILLIIPSSLDPTDPDLIAREKSIITVLGFRTHHAIADGLSNLNFLQNLFKTLEPSMTSIIHDNESNKVNPNFLGVRSKEKSQNTKNQINNLMGIFFRTTEFCYSSLSNMFWMPLVYKRFFQDFFLSRNSFTEKKIAQSTSLAFTQFPLNEFKEMQKAGEVFLKKTHNFSHLPLAVIVLSSFARSLRRFLLETTQENDLPNHINILYSLPLQGDHPNDRLCNHWTQGIFKLDVKEEDPLRNFEKTALNFQEVLNLNAPELIHSLSKLFFLLPKFIIKMMINFNMGAPMGLTNLRGPSKDTSFLGCKVASMSTVTGLLWRHAAITLGMISYNGDLSISMLANNQVISNDQHAKQILNEYFVEEILKLKLQLQNSV